MPTKIAEPAPRPLRVLTTYRRMIPSVRWFGTEQLRWLADRGFVELRAVPQGRLRAKDCRWADCVVLTRADTPFELWLARRLVGMGRRLLYVLDDDLEHVPQGLGSSTYYRDLTVVRLGRAVRQCCDLLITHSPLLESAYGAGFAKVVRIEQPAMLAQAQGPLREAAPSAAGPGEVVRIGFSGSEDRAADVQRVMAEPLRQLKAHFGSRVEIEFFGACPPLVRELGLAHIPYTASAEAYYRTMARLNWDIGLAPLENSRFYQCKYYNKFVEYCTYGIVGVYADLPPYRGVVRDGTDGVLCGENEWFSTLRDLVENAEMRKRLSQAAQLRAQDFALDKVSMRFWKALEETLGGWRAPESRLSAASLDMARAACGMLLAWQTLRRHGLRVFSLAWRRFRGRGKGGQT